MSDNLNFTHKEFQTILTAVGLSFSVDLSDEAWADFGSLANPEYTIPSEEDQATQQNQTQTSQPAEAQSGQPLHRETLRHMYGWIKITQHWPHEHPVCIPLSPSRPEWLLAPAIQSPSGFIPSAPSAEAVAIDGFDESNNDNNDEDGFFGLQPALKKARTQYELPRDEKEAKRARETWERKAERERQKAEVWERLRNEALEKEEVFRERSQG